MEENEKVSLPMILKRLVEEGHHISEVKKPHLRKIFPQVLKDPKVREIHSCKPFNLKELPTESINTLIGGGGGGAKVKVSLRSVLNIKLCESMGLNFNAQNQTSNNVWVKSSFNCCFN